MAIGPRYSVPFRRRREGKTDYRVRLNLLKSHKTRAVVRKTLGNIIVQFTNYDEKGDKVLVSATARELKKLGYAGSPDSTAAAYLTGLLAGHRAKEKQINEAVLDLGIQTPSKGSRVFASLRGILDAGVHVPHGKGIFPTPDRIKGAHLKGYSEENFGGAWTKIMGKDYKVHHKPHVEHEGKKGKAPETGKAPAGKAPHTGAKPTEKPKSVGKEGGEKKEVKPAASPKEGEKKESKEEKGKKKEA